MNNISLAQTFSLVAGEMRYLLNETPVAGGKLAGMRQSASAMSDDDLAFVRATIYYAERRRRSQFLPDDILGEPGWDILLDLFIAAKSGKWVATTSVCHAAAVPATTALRWLDRLEEKGFIERERDLVDTRRVNVRLSRYGHDCLNDLFLFDRPGATRRFRAAPASGDGSPPADCPEPLDPNPKAI